MEPTTALNNQGYQTYFQKAIPYDVYLRNFESELAGSDSPYAQYIPLNFQRSSRIAKTLKLSDDLKKALQLLDRQLNWLVISEHWCGDASQILPLINAIAEASEGKITLRIIYRDANPELMNAHLTNGSKSIPKLIQLDEQFNLLASWGPRPTEAQALVMRLKSDPETAKTYSEAVHTWYAHDKTASTQLELLKLLA
ncbi:MAG: thioredoxin family protein [Bacteroidota bacterium]